MTDKSATDKPGVSPLQWFCIAGAGLIVAPTILYVGWVAGDATDNGVIQAVSPQINSAILTAASVGVVGIMILAAVVFVAHLLRPMRDALAALPGVRDDIAAIRLALLEQTQPLPIMRIVGAAATGHAPRPLAATPITTYVSSAAGATLTGAQTAAPTRNRRRRKPRPKAPTFDSNYRSYLAGIADQTYTGRGDDADSVG